MDDLSHVYARPITTAAQALAFCNLLGAAGLTFHPDDSPETIINVRTGERIFTDYEAGFIRQRVQELHALLPCIYSAMMAAEDREHAPAPALKDIGTGGGCEALYRWDASRSLSLLITNDLAVPRPGELMEIGIYSDEHTESCVAWWGWCEEGGVRFVDEAQAARVAEALLAYWAS